MNILFFGKKNNYLTRKCLEFLKNMNLQVDAYIGERGDAFPEECEKTSFDILISFSSPWIIPASLLKKAKVAALNFHPGPPEYPGIGCTNFAIYNEEKEFGVTCHHMYEKVDAGPVVMVRRFPIFEADSVETLTDRCYFNMYSLFMDVMSTYFKKRDIPVSNEKWARKPYTRKQLNELCHITLDMDEKEVTLRVKATSFPGYPGAYIEFQNTRFEVPLNHSKYNI